MDKRLVWVDIETTGLNVENDSILEIGLMITDHFGNKIDSTSSLVGSGWRVDDFVSMPDVVKEMHSKSGLLHELIWTSNLSARSVEQALCNWLKESGLNDPPMWGSSVHFDRAFLKAKMPKLEAMFSYRNGDISSIKEICRRVNPGLLDRLNELLPKRGIHRAIPDLEDSINEYIFYLNEFLQIGV